eukprot:9508239-Alexandrium_andersonii.AAC.1
MTVCAHLYSAGSSGFRVSALLGPGVGQSRTSALRCLHTQPDAASARACQHLRPACNTPPAGCTSGF